MPNIVQDPQISSVAPAPRRCGLVATGHAQPARCSLRAGEADLPDSSPSASGAGASRKLEQALAHQPHLGHAAPAHDLEEIEAPLAEVEQVVHVATSARLDAGEDLLDASVVAVGGDEQTTERVVRARVVVQAAHTTPTIPTDGGLSTRGTRSTAASCWCVASGALRPSWFSGATSPVRSDESASTSRHGCSTRRDAG